MEREEPSRFKRYFADHPVVGDCLKVLVNPRLYPLYPLLPLLTWSIGQSIFSPNPEERNMSSLWRQFSDGVEQLISNHWFMALYLLGAFYCIFWAAHNVRKRHEARLAEENEIRADERRAMELAFSRKTGEISNIVRPVIVAYFLNQKEKTLSHAIERLRPILGRYEGSITSMEAGNFSEESPPESDPQYQAREIESILSSASVHFTKRPEWPKIAPTDRIRWTTGDHRRFDPEKNKQFIAQHRDALTEYRERLQLMDQERGMIEGQLDGLNDQVRQVYEQLGLLDK